MKNEEIIEYHPNGRIKYKIAYHDNGIKCNEHFYDQYGFDHREDNLPDFQGWYENGILCRKSYCYHGELHNINNPAKTLFHENGKIGGKYYYLKKSWSNNAKLTWVNQIKNI